MAGKAKAAAKAKPAGKGRTYTTKRTKQIEDAVLHALSTGQTLTSICEEVGIHYTTWRSWCRADEALDIAHARARDEGFDAIAESTLAIADDGRNDFVEKLAEEGDPKAKAYDAEHVQRSKLRIETRLKLLAKWDPKRYGDRTAIDLTTQPNKLSDAELDAAIAARLAEINAERQG